MIYSCSKLTLKFKKFKVKDQSDHRQLWFDQKKVLNLKKIRILKTIKSLGRMWERSRQIERQLG